MRFLLVAATVLIGAVGAGCGGSGTTNATSSGGASATTGAPAGGGSSASAAGGGGASATGGGASGGASGGGGSSGSGGGGSDAIPAAFFGLHLKNSTPWPTIAFGAVRLWDSGTRWQQLDQSGTYDFTQVDTYLALAKTHDVEVLYTISATPKYASSDMNNPMCDYASTATGSCAPPSDLNDDGSGKNAHYRRFLSALVKHVRDLDPAHHAPITAYELWNEFTRDTSSWTGSNEQMVRLAEDAKCIVQGTGTIHGTGEACTAANFGVPVGLAPSAVMLTPDSVLTDPEATNFGNYLGTPHALEAADVISVHGYVQNGMCCALAEKLVDRWHTLQTLLGSSGGALPVWSSEGSWGQSDATHDNMEEPPNLDLEEAFVARYYLVGWSVGFRRLYWYAYDNPSWGTLWSAGALTPAGVAYGTVYGWMVGATMTKPCAPTVASGPTWTCELTKAGKKRLVVWDTSQTCEGTCTTSQFAVPNGYAAYRDTRGTSHPVMGQSAPIGLKPILLE